MKLYLTILIAVLASIATVSAAQIIPNQDVLVRGGDGELVQIFPGGLTGFGNPVYIIDGIAYIGMGGLAKAQEMGLEPASVRMAA